MFVSELNPRDAPSLFIRILQLLFNLGKKNKSQISLKLGLRARIAVCHRNDADKNDTELNMLISTAGHHLIQRHTKATKKNVEKY